MSIPPQKVRKHPWKISPGASAIQQGGPENRSWSSVSQDLLDTCDHFAVADK